MMRPQGLMPQELITDVTLNIYYEMSAKPQWRYLAACLRIQYNKPPLGLYVGQCHKSVSLKALLKQPTNTGFYTTPYVSQAFDSRYLDGCIYIELNKYSLIQLIVVFALVANIYTCITNISLHGKYLRIWRCGEWPAPIVLLVISTTFGSADSLNQCA